MALMAMLVAAPLAAQEPATDASRAAEQARLQAEKSRHLTPIVPNKAERIAARLQNSSLLGNQPQGFYPWVGSVMGGGWLAFGAGYRATVGDQGAVNLLGGWSIKNYKLLDSTVALPLAADSRVRLDLGARWIDAPGVSFYGIGNASQKADKTSFLYRPTRVGATLGVKLTDWLSVGGGADYLDVQTGRGRIGSSIEDRFTPARAPALGGDLAYGIARGYAAIDWRESPGYTTRGGLYRADWARYTETGGGHYSFDRLDVDLRQFVPVLRANWVLAFRGTASFTTPQDGAEVPHFMMPFLGSGDTLRAFPNRRFYDRNALLVQAEYRWTPSKFVDMALFYDAGKVGPTSGDLDLDDLHKDVGIGIRFHGPQFTAFRFEVAKGQEGLVLVFTTGAF